MPDRRALKFGAGCAIAIALVTPTLAAQPVTPTTSSGTPMATGSGAISSSTPRVVPAAGSVIGIDQTTPGNTNGVVVNSPTYQLLSNASSSGSVFGPVTGGAYQIDVRGTLGGTTINFQVTGADGSYSTFAQATTTGTIGPYCIAAGSSVQAIVTGGSPSGLYATLGGTGAASCGSSTVTVSSSALPTGAATSALQSSTITALSNVTVTGALPAGSAQIGAIIPAATGSACCGIVPQFYGGVQSTLQIKASAGGLYSVYATAGSAAPGYLMIFNSTTTPVNGAVTPVDCIYVPALATVGFDRGFGPPEYFSTGIYAAFSSTGCFTLTLLNSGFIRGLAK